MCRDITIFDLESRTSIAAKRSRSERAAADAFVRRRVPRCSHQSLPAMRAAAAGAPYRGAIHVHSFACSLELRGFSSRLAAAGRHIGERGGGPFYIRVRRFTYARGCYICEDYPQHTTLIYKSGTCSF